MRAMGPRLDESMPVGNEGGGVVIGAGSSAEAQALLGKLVAVAGGAMYAQYRCADARLCLELPEGTRPADGASSFVNPMTALGMVETMRLENHVALVHTAGASNLGQMLNRLCIAERVPLVSIVRKREQEELLRSAGAAYVCDSTSPQFMADLTGALTATGATLAFDAVGGGKLASQILTCMEAAATASASGYSRYGSAVHKQVYIYGSLDRGPTELTRNFGMAWGIGGWLLTPFLSKIGPAGMDRLRRQVAAGLTTTFASRYTSEVSLAGVLAPGAIAGYARQALENFNFFGAPHVAIVHTDEALGVYGAIDCGGYVTSFMLAAQARGHEIWFCEPRHLSLEHADAGEAVLERCDELQLPPGRCVLVTDLGQLGPQLEAVAVCDRDVAGADVHGSEQEAVAGQTLVEPLGTFLERGVSHRPGREADPGADHREVVEMVVDAFELEQQGPDPA